MLAFGLDIDPATVDAIVVEVESKYPNEACGVVLGRSTSSELTRVVPLTNVQDRFHKVDPQQFPRTSRDAFRLDDLQRMRMLEQAESDGLRERILFHSHCDAAAYFSAEDRAMAVQDGMELMPGVVYLVASVVDAKCVDLAAYVYEDGRFLERRLSLGTSPAISERNPTVRTAPGQSGLVRSILDADEFKAWAGRCDQQVTVDDPSFWVAVAAASHGSYSPMKSWSPSLPTGAWRPNESSSPMHLVDAQGSYEAVAVGARVFACPQRIPSVVDPLDHRAEILRQGILRVEAVVGAQAPADSKVLRWVVGEHPNADIRVHALQDEWVTAAARNHGATHVIWNGDTEL